MRKLLRESDKQFHDRKDKEYFKKMGFEGEEVNRAFPSYMGRGFLLHGRRLEAGDTETLTRELAASDEYRKKGNYNSLLSAKNMLAAVYLRISETKEGKSLPDEQKLKILEATERRTNRVLRAMSKYSSKEEGEMPEMPIENINYVNKLKDKLDREIAILKKRGVRVKSSGLEATWVIIAVIGLFGAIFFLSSNITGNVIGNLTQSSSNLFGAVLFLVGIVGAIFYFRKK